ncbi:MAG: hypothetical protein NT105_01450 [Verrucomicrobia bacterium]|nr:hypothetical protein [Verrucomicrobiota bacterium]
MEEVAQDTEFLNGKCPSCQGHFEFPKHGLGQTVECPHCRALITLLEQKEETITPPVLKKPDVTIDYFKTSDGEILGHCAKSPNRQFRLVWCDQWAAGHSRTKGPFYLFHGETEVCKGQLQRPNDGQVTDTGSFILCDWLFTQNLSSVFYAFNNRGEILIERKLRANLYNAAISPDGLFAACQTAVNKQSPQGDLLTLFDLASRKEIWHVHPPFWPEVYEFNSQTLELTIRGSSSVYRSCTFTMTPAPKR